MLKRAITAVLVVAAIAALVFWIPAVKRAVVTPTVVRAKTATLAVHLAALAALTPSPGKVRWSRRCWAFLLRLLGAKSRLLILTGPAPFPAQRT